MEIVWVSLHLLLHSKLQKKLPVYSVSWLSKVVHDQKPICDFLLVFHCNYIAVFYHFRDITTYLSKNLIFLPFSVTPVLFENLAMGVLWDPEYESLYYTSPWATRW